MPIGIFTVHGVFYQKKSVLLKDLLQFQSKRQGWAEINKDTIVKVTVDKPEVSSLHIASYKQTTNRKPSYIYVEKGKAILVQAWT